MVILPVIQGAHQVSPFIVPVFLLMRISGGPSAPEFTVDTHFVGRRTFLRFLSRIVVSRSCRIRENFIAVYPVVFL